MTVEQLNASIKANNDLIEANRKAVAIKKEAIAKNEAKRKSIEYNLSEANKNLKPGERPLEPGPQYNQLDQENLDLAYQNQELELQIEATKESNKNLQENLRQALEKEAEQKLEEAATEAKKATDEVTKAEEALKNKDKELLSKVKGRDHDGVLKSIEGNLNPAIKNMYNNTWKGMLKDDEKAQREDLKNKLKDAKNTSEAKQKALQDLNQHQAKPNNGQNFQNPDVLEQILSQKQPGSVAPSQNKSTDIDALLQDIFPQNKNLNSTKNACPIRAPGKQNLINNPPATPPAKSKSNFDKYQPEILKHEGGFVDDPDDPGGATNKGITFATFKAHAKKDLGIEPTLENLKALTDEQAGIIYKKNYWDTVKGDQIKSSSLGYALYDFNVNAGKNSVKVMQKTLNEMGANLTVDGGMGDKTVEAINKADPEVLFEKYQANRKQYYKDIIAKNPKLQKFEKGWMKRVDSMEFDDPVEEQPQLPNNFPPILP